MPSAKPVNSVAPDTKFEITCYVYGDANTAAQLFEDDGLTFDCEKSNFNTVNLLWNKGKGAATRSGNFKDIHYLIKDLQAIR